MAVRRSVVNAGWGLKCSGRPFVIHAPAGVWGGGG